MKEYCCQIKVDGKVDRIWDYDTNQEAQDKMNEIQSTSKRDIEIFAGKTVNKDRKRTNSVILQEEINEIIETLNENYGLQYEM